MGDNPQSSLGAQTTSARIVSGADYLNLPRAPETWLIEPVLPSGGSLLLYGDPKVGKSFAALQLAISLTGTGKPETPDPEPLDWLGFHIPEPKRVCYIQLDTPRSLWADRVAALRAAGMQTDSLFLADRETLGCWPFDILNPQHEAILASSLAEVAPDVVIMDTLRECCVGSDENDSTAMQAVIAHLTAAVNPAALVIVAHSKKPNPDAPYSTINGNRGSSYVPGRMDAIAHFTHDGVSVVGRAIEEVKVGLEKQEIPGGFLWRLNDRSRVKQLAHDLLKNDSLPSLRAKARHLAEQTGREEGACLMMLSRMQKAEMAVTSPPENGMLQG